MTIKKSRESGVELLRIIAILGVIMIHFSDRALPVLSELGGGGGEIIAPIIFSFTIIVGCRYILDNLGLFHVL